MSDVDNKKIACADCRFKFRKSEMLEKASEEEGRGGEWYCRRCVPWNRG